MSATVCTKMETEHISIRSANPVEDYTTTPMTAIEPRHDHGEEDEEVLYASFEEAIKQRIIAMKNDEGYRREQTTEATFMLPDTDRLPVSVENEKAPAIGIRKLFWRGIQHIWHNRQQIIITMCSGLILIMLGFDIMGLLVLWLR